MATTHCPFCTIDEKRQRILVGGKRVYVMPSNPQLVPLHLLVIPRRHVELPWKLTRDERKEVQDITILLQRKIMAFHDGLGCDVTQHCRPFQPQDERKVDHCHWQIRPRTFKDELYQHVQIHETDLFRKLLPEQMEEEMTVLRNMLGLPQPR